MSEMPVSAACHRPYYEEGLSAGRDPFGKDGVRGLVGKVLLAGEEADKGTSLLGHVVSDGATQHRIALLRASVDATIVSMADGGRAGYSPARPPSH
jgi:hypothetical protein